MREKIAIIRGYLRYLAAILNWISSVIALETFPKKSDFFIVEPGHKPGEPSHAEATVGRDNGTDSQVLDGSVKV